MRLIIAIFLIYFTFSCKKKLDEHQGVFNYSIELKSPDASSKTMGQKISIDIIFESGLDKTIHNINIKIYDKANSKKAVFNEPFDSHIHGKNPYNYKRNLVLSSENGFYAGTWVLDVRVWAKKEKAIKKKIEFAIE